MNPHLQALLGTSEEGVSLHPDHATDLAASGLTLDTILRQRLRSVPPSTIARLLGFDPHGVKSALLIPFPDPAGGWMDHVRLKVFPPQVSESGTIKYLQRRGSGVRVFFPLATMPAVLGGHDVLHVVEGEKKALAVAQIGLPAVGIAGVEGWHIAGSRALLPDFDCIRLRGRPVDLVPDADVATNPNVARAVEGLAAALEARGARVSVVRLGTAELV